MGKGKPKKGGVALGRALQKQRFGTAGRRTHEQETEIHTAAIANPKADAALKLRSMTETSDLVELMHNAALAEADFTAQKANTILITKDSFSGNAEGVLPSQAVLDSLKLPRRPPWTKEMSPEELDSKERASFLEWRRSLAALEEQHKLVFTPFEKNLEVWRQLWRVVERSDIILQIVDARNPLLFFSRDLQAYVREVDPRKQHVLLINKADFLSLGSRLAWAHYLRRHGVVFLFWSANWDSLPSALQQRLQLDPHYQVPALNELMPEDEPERPPIQRDVRSSDRAPKHEPPPGGEEEEEEEEEEDENDLEEGEEEEEYDDDLEEEGDDEDEGDKVQDDQVDKKKSPSPVDSKPAAAASSTTASTPEAAAAAASASSLSSPPPSKTDESIVSEADLAEAHIHSRSELIARLSALSGPREDRLVVGTVGYPNVGKSSTVNVLAGSKRVTVSATPGKTKRFQTLLIEENIMLVDCPGLVFPNLLASKAEMICNGLLPIDQLRDAVPPVGLVCDRIPREVLETRYGIVLPQPDPPGAPPSAHDLLQAYGYIRGFMTAHGSPDESRAARLVLKDYVSGRLLYCHKPPADDSAEALARSISPPLQAPPAPSLFASMPRPAPTASRAPTMRQSDAAFERQAEVMAFTSGRAGGGAAFTRVSRAHVSPVPLVRPATTGRKAPPRNKINLSRLAAAPPSKKLG